MMMTVPAQATHYRQEFGPSGVTIMRSFGVQLFIAPVGAGRREDELDRMLALAQKVNEAYYATDLVADGGFPILKMDQDTRLTDNGPQVLIFSGKEYYGWSWDLTLWDET